MFNRITSGKSAEISKMKSIKLKNGSAQRNGRLFQKTAAHLARVVLFLGAVFMCSSQAQELNQVRDGYETVIEKSFQVSSGGELLMQRTSGDVLITGWEKNEVHVKYNLRMEVLTETEAMKMATEAAENFTQSDSRVSIEGVGRRASARSKFVINVPKNFSIDVRSSSGDVEVEDVSGKFDLTTAGGEVAMYRLKGNVKFRTSGGNITLEEIQGPVRGSTSGGSIRVDNVDGETDVKTSGGDIRVRDVKKNIAVHTSGGNIALEDVLGEIEARTSGGWIRARNCKQNTRLRTSGGDIRLSTMGGEVRANTSGGDIDGEGFGNEVSVSTSGGDIILKDVKSAVEASTSGGDIEMEMTLEDFTKSHWVDLRSRGGDVQAILPADLPASIVAEIRLERLKRYSQRYDILSDFPLSREQEEEGDFKTLRAKGEINGGGDSVYIFTINGEITIKKGN